MRAEDRDMWDPLVYLQGGGLGWPRAPYVPPVLIHPDLEESLYNGCVGDVMDRCPGFRGSCPQLLFSDKLGGGSGVAHRLMPPWPRCRPALLCPPACWAIGKCHRIFFSRLTDKAVKDYSAYRSSLLFWALVDLIYNMFKVGKPLEARLVSARV